MDIIDLFGCYEDFDLKVIVKFVELLLDMVVCICDEFNKICFIDDDIIIFLGEYLLEFKFSVFFEVWIEELFFVCFF